jgi:hypothetical protein
MAEFLEDSAGVFRNIDGCLIREDTTTKHANHAKLEYIRNVVIGCDVAKHTDWTVLIAMDAETGRCFAMERFNHLDWPIQKERILGFARKYRGRLILDATGVGDPIFDDLKRVYGDIEPFKFTPLSKTELVQRLIVAVEQRKVSWPGPRPSFAPAASTPGATAGACQNWEVLTSEMRRYEYAIGPSGGITYSAPAGYHDDCVMALALANHRRWETESVGRMYRVEGGGRRRIGRAVRRERVLVG